MRKLYFYYTEGGDDFAETEVVFDQDGTPIGIWASNDACWEREYFSPFMALLGYECVNVDGGKWEEMAYKYIRETWG